MTKASERPLLTPRQAEALRLYAEIGSGKDVATAMGITPQRVKNLLADARRRLGVRFTIEAIWTARARGLLK